jgi:hypothetical protein
MKLKTKKIYQSIIRLFKKFSLQFNLWIGFLFTNRKKMKDLNARTRTIRNQIKKFYIKKEKTISNLKKKY